jgi:hypothetical protein
VSVPASEKNGSEPSSSSLPSEVFRGLVSIAICLYLLGFALTVGTGQDGEDQDVFAVDGPSLAGHRL